MSFEKAVPLSVYCRATSATASPIFLRTSVTDSVVRHQLLTDHHALFVGQGQEDLLGLADNGILAGLGCDSSEKDGGECTRLFVIGQS
jgi:hypothetical protein